MFAQIAVGILLLGVCVAVAFLIVHALAQVLDEN